MKNIKKLALVIALTAPACLVNAQGAGQAGGAANAGAGQASNGQLPGQNLNAERGIMHWNPYNQDPWFTNPYMVQQLRMQPELLNKLQNNYQQNYGKYQENLNRLPNNLPEGELARRQQELAQQFENNFSGSLDQSIPDQPQRQRFQQMMTQYQGLNAFDSSNVLKRLDLSVEQRRQINRMQQEWRRTMTRLSRANGNIQDFDWNDFYRRSNLSVDEILTPDQLRIWREIRGENLDLPADVYFRAQQNGGGVPNNSQGNTPGTDRSKQ